MNAEQVAQKATDYFTTAFSRSDTYNVHVTTASYVSGNVTLAATGTVRSAFMKVFNIQEIPVAARAVVAAAKDGLGCVVSLSGTASGAATVQGTADINLKGCSLYDNSSHGSALTVGGSGKLSALSVEVVGNVSGRAGITTTQGVNTGASPLQDPYASVSFPPFSGCAENNYTAKNDETIGPGVYCQGIKVNAGVTLTLLPGIYYLDRGDLSVNGGATVNGTGVTLVFTSSTGNNYANATINGGAIINLTPPTTGPTAGIVIYGDRSMPTGTAFNFAGGATQSLTGAIYLPKGDVSFAGGADTTTGCTKLIGDTVKFTGNSNFALNCTGLGTKPIGAMPIRLTQ
jgi:hypothetical protein